MALDAWLCTPPPPIYSVDGVWTTAIRPLQRYVPATWWISRMFGNDLRRDPSLLFCDLTQVTDEASVLLVKTIQVRISCALRMRARSEK